jgi:hypothetical protein
LAFDFGICFFAFFAIVYLFLATLHSRREPLSSRRAAGLPVRGLLSFLR